MRPTDKETGAVWRLLEGWQERQQQADPLKRRVTQGDMARLFGVSDQLISEWKFRQSQMQTDDMMAVSERTDIAFSDLAVALKEDMPAILEHHATRRSTKTPPKGSVSSRD